MRRRTRGTVGATLTVALAAVALVIVTIVQGVAGGAQAQGARGDAARIAAASDLKFALDELAATFEERTGRRVEVSYGSSGNLFRQIVQGAPFEMFLSADEAFVTRLVRRGLTEDEGTLYAVGRVVLFQPAHAPWRVEAGLAGLRAALREGRLKRFAIANPEHAPYGRAAEQVLRSQGLWEQVAPHLVLGENVSQAAQFATAGSTQGGIFAYSLALAPTVAERGAYLLLPEAWHEPLRQRMVLIADAGGTARDFYAFVQRPAARDVLARYGFSLPGAGD